MRSETNAEKVRRLIERLGRAAKGPGVVFVSGGTSAVLVGWRDSTLDADLKLDPEPAGIFEAIARLKDELDMNVELAAPDDFVPAVPGWRERSPVIATSGPVEFRHFDFLSQSLAKLERGHRQDLEDVQAMIRIGLVRTDELRDAFQRIVPQLPRYPAIDLDEFRRKVDEFVAAREGDHG